MWASVAYCIRDLHGGLCIQHAWNMESVWGTEDLNLIVRQE